MTLPKMKQLLCHSRYGQPFLGDNSSHRYRSSSIQGWQDQSDLVMIIVDDNESTRHWNQTCSTGSGSVLAAKIRINTGGDACRSKTRPFEISTTRTMEHYQLKTMTVAWRIATYTGFLRGLMCLPGNPKGRLNLTAALARTGSRLKVKR